MNLFFALLAIAAVAATALTAATLVPVFSGLRRLGGDIGDVALWLALLVATTATAGSLYYSEVANFTPCKLCWFQRICMYPLVSMLAVAARRGDRQVWRYGLPLCVAGAAISIYHYQLQRFPDQQSGVCTLEAPCTAKEVEQFGFITIPLMALAGFVFVGVLLVRSTAANRSVNPSVNQSVATARNHSHHPIEEIFAP